MARTMQTALKKQHGNAPTGVCDVTGDTEQWFLPGGEESSSSAPPPKRKREEEEEEEEDANDRLAVAVTALAERAASRVAVAEKEFGDAECAERSRLTKATDALRRKAERRLAELATAKRSRLASLAKAETARLAQLRSEELKRSSTGKLCAECWQIAEPRESHTAKCSLANCKSVDVCESCVAAEPCGDCSKLFCAKEALQTCSKCVTEKICGSCLPTTKCSVCASRFCKRCRTIHGFKTAGASGQACASCAAQQAQRRLLAMYGGHGYGGHDSDDSNASGFGGDY